MTALLAVTDPLLEHGLDTTVVLIIIGKTIAVFVLLLLSVLMYIWFLRKVIAKMQNRIGPDRAGPVRAVPERWPTASSCSSRSSRSPTPPTGASSASRPTWRCSPRSSRSASCPSAAWSPSPGTRRSCSSPTSRSGSCGCSRCRGSASTACCSPGGRRARSTRCSARCARRRSCLSYEAAFGLAIVGVLVQSNTLSTRGIVTQQGWDGFKSIFNGDWYWLPAIVALVIFVIAAVAETNHPPFDLVEAEQELTGGFFTEYTGIKFAIFYLAEFMNVITMCAIAVTLFFGGPNGPGLGFLPANGWFNAWVMPVFWFLFKVILLLFGTVWLRASLPRLRYDQLMALGWKFLIEIAFLWVMISGVVIVAKEEGWSMWIVLPAAIVGALACRRSLLPRAMPKRDGDASRRSG